MTPFILNVKNSYDVDGNLLTTDQYCGKYALVAYAADGTIISSDEIDFTFDQATSVVDAAVEAQLAALGITGATLGEPIVCMSGLTVTSAGGVDVAYLTLSAKIWDCTTPEPECEEAWQEMRTIVNYSIVKSEFTCTYSMIAEHPAGTVGAGDTRFSTYQVICDPEDNESFAMATLIKVIKDCAGTITEYAQELLTVPAESWDRFVISLAASDTETRWATQVNLLNKLDDTDFIIDLDPTTSPYLSGPIHTVNPADLYAVNLASNDYASMTAINQLIMQIIENALKTLYNADNGSEYQMQLATTSSGLTQIALKNKCTSNSDWFQVGESIPHVWVDSSDGPIVDSFTGDKVGSYFKKCTYLFDASISAPCGTFIYLHEIVGVQGGGQSDCSVGQFTIDGDGYSRFYLTVAGTTSNAINPTTLEDVYPNPDPTAYVKVFDPQSIVTPLSISDPLTCIECELCIPGIQDGQVTWSTGETTACISVPLEPGTVYTANVSVNGSNFPLTVTL